MSKPAEKIFSYNSKTDSKGVVTVFIPVVVSDVIHENKLTYAVDYFIEQLFIAYKLPKLASTVKSPVEVVKNTANFISSLAVVIGGVYLIKNPSVIKKLLNIEDNSKSSKKSESIDFINHSHILSEASDKLFADKPVTVNLGDLTFRFECINVKSKQELDHVLKQGRNIFSWILKTLRRLFFNTLGIVSKEVFYVYTQTEVPEDMNIEDIVKKQHVNIIVVDTVDEKATAYIHFDKHTATINTVSLEDINIKSKSKPIDNIDKVIRDLKKVKVQRM